jgi:predicted nuclease of predicted toxin-antitoxin system
MRVLLDTCVHGAAVQNLAAAGHDVTWVGELPADPGDEAILAMAFSEGRVVVTLDKDFGELAVVRRQPHAGIVRLVRHSAQQQGPACVEVLRRFESDLSEGAILTVEPGRVRVRPPD